MPLELEKDLIQNGGEFEILGSPITLPDVLREIGKGNKHVEFRMGISESIFLIGCDVHPDENSYIHWHEWNLKEDYDSQLQPTKDFIGNLLGVE